MDGGNEIMKEQNNLRRGIAVGVATLTGLSVAALGVVGFFEHTDLAAQRDIALVSAADDARESLIAAQVGLDHDQFLNDTSLQQSIYAWALEPTADGGLGLPDAALFFPGDANDPADSLFNGAFSRFTEADLVGQALMQAQLDALLGVNQTLGAGGYETAIGPQLFDDLSGAGIAPDSALAGDLANLIDPETLASVNGFEDALTALHGDLMQAAWSDLFGMFSIGDVTP